MGVPRRLSYDPHLGPQRNEARDLFAQGASLRSSNALVHHRVAAIVTAYDHLAQTVTARPITGLLREAYTNVAIDPGASAALLATGISTDPADPTIGWLVFTEEGSGQPRDKTRSNDARGTKHQPKPVCFEPGRLRPINDAITDRTTLLSLDGETNRIGPQDYAITIGDAAIIIRADRGDGKSQIVLVADDIVTMEPTQSDGDLKAVGRDGDSSITTLSATGLLRSG